MFHLTARFTGSRLCTLATLVSTLAFFPLFSARALINDVVETNLLGDAPAVIGFGTFDEDVLSFSDRTHQHNGAAFNSTTGLLSTTGTTVVPLPDYLLGGDYVRFANNARDNAGYQAVVTTANPADFYLLIDNRSDSVARNTSSSNTTDPILGGTLAWISEDGWERVTTGISPGTQADYTAVDEDGNGTGPGNGLNQFYSVYRLSGLTEVTLKEQNIPGGNMYALVVVPAVGLDLPIRSYFSTPARMLEGESAQLRWSIAPNATAATINNGVGDVLDQTDVEGRGEATVFPDVSTDYTLSVTTPSGTDVQTVKVEVFALASFTTANPRISIGSTSNLRWVVSPNAVSVIIKDDEGNETDVSADTFFGIGSFLFTPEKDTTYTLTVTTPNTIETATTTVRVRLIERFTAAPAFFDPAGGTTTLTWRVRPDVSLTLVDSGPIFADEFGEGDTSVQITGTRSFTLTAEAQDRVETQTLAVLAQPAGTTFALLDIGATGGSVQSGAANGAQIGAGPNNTNGVNLASTTVTANSGATFTVAIDNISATGAVVGGLDWRDRGNSSVPFGALAEDFVKNNSGVVRVTLGDLPAGNYSVVAFFIDPDFSQSSTINIIATDADRTAVDTGIMGDSSYPDLLPGIGGLVESHISTRARVFPVRANGTDNVILVFDGRGGPDNETPLAGLLLIGTDGNSPLKIISFDYARGTRDATLTLVSKPGETFRIEVSDDLVNWTVLDAAFPAASTGNQTSYVEANPGLPLIRRFYRVRRN